VDGHADQAANHVIWEGANGNPDIGYVIKGVLNNYMTFFERKNQDSNKSRWPRWRRWERLLGEVEKLKLSQKAPDKTLDQRKAWIDKQTPKTLAKLFLTTLHDYDSFSELIDYGVESFNEKDWNELETHRRKKLLLQREQLFLSRNVIERQTLLTQMEKKNLIVIDENIKKIESELDRTLYI
jgi:phage replication initiation protein